MNIARAQSRPTTEQYRRALYPIPEGPRMAGRMPELPRARLGEITVLPQVDGAWKPIADRWVLPGCRVVGTDELYQVAIANAWPIFIYSKE